MSFPQIEWADGYENGYKEQKKMGGCKFWT